MWPPGWTKIAFAKMKDLFISTSAGPFFKERTARDELHKGTPHGKDARQQRREKSRQKSEIDQDERPSRFSRSFARNRCGRPVGRRSHSRTRLWHLDRGGPAAWPRTCALAARPPRASTRASVTPRNALRLSSREPDAPRVQVSLMWGCRQPRRDAGFEGFSISRPDLSNGASRRGNAPRLARSRSGSASAIWRRRLFPAKTAAPVVSLPLRTSACASVPTTDLTRTAGLRSPIGAKQWSNRPIPP